MLLSHLRELNLHTSSACYAKHKIALYDTDIRERATCGDNQNEDVESLFSSDFILFNKTKLSI